MTDEKKITTVREGRHVARIALGFAAEALTGREGLTQEEQAQALETAGGFIEQAHKAVLATKLLAEKRDFEKHQAEKDGPPDVTHLYADLLAAEAESVLAEEAAEV